MRSLPAVAVGLTLSGAAMPVAAATAAKCTRGWAGTAEYSRHQASSDSKTVTRVSGKGTQTTDVSLNYDYVAQIAVRPAPDAEYSLGRASINLNSVATETVNSNDEMICPHERVKRQMSGSSVSRSQTKGSENGVETGVDITEDTGGTYTVSVRLPGFKGTASGSNSASFTGQCKPKQATNREVAEMPATIEGLSFSSSGEDRINPRDPNRVQGSHSVTAYGVTESLRWSLRRCGGDLRLADIKFEDMRFPTWDAWQEITGQIGTIDGNIVRITAVVANDGPDEKAATVKFRDTYKGDKWDGAKPDGLLGEVSVTVPAGEQREVEFKWDSSGYAWYDDGRPRYVQRVKAEVEDKGKTVDDMTRNLKVAPKPLVLVHGLWSNWKKWEAWQNILTTSHSYDWKAFPVGEKPEHGRMNTGEEVGNTGPTNTIAQNADQLGRYIEYAQKDRNAWHVDIVAHSMGGLISRRYIHAMMPSYADGKPQVARLVMLGTPNRGSRCADLVSVPLDIAGRPMEALRELRPSAVEKFNAINTERKGVEFSVLAGNPLPTGCNSLSRNDGLVTVSSATWMIEDNAQMSLLNTALTETGPFSEFVKPRLAIGPSGRKTTSTTAARLMIVGADEAAEPEQVSPDFSLVMTLAPGATKQVSIPVKEAGNFGLTFVAKHKVSATLADDGGAVVGSSLANQPEAAQLFRSLFVDRAVSKGNWTLTLKNEDEIEREVILSTWSTALP
ncbi:MAG TPA: hypothetical protein VN047_02260 [Sphingopyxis sp.]|nr:hypothetical protein [Sphingopyxis sp.]